MKCLIPHACRLLPVAALLLLHGPIVLAADPPPATPTNQSSESTKSKESSESTKLAPSILSTPSTPSTSATPATPVAAATPATLGTDALAALGTGALATQPTTAGPTGTPAVSPIISPATPVAAAAPAAAPIAPPVLDGGKTGEPKLQLNFQSVPIDTVLDYLSQAAGIVVVHDGPLTGTVTVVSKQPLNADEAVDLLHTVLNGQGYAVIRNGRILQVVKNNEARTRDLPIYTGSDPEAVPKTDEIVTQIIPIRHTNASKMVETLKPLLPAQSMITVNDDSNSMVLTDTRITIHRIMEIVQALDTAVASILDIKVITLRYADATDTAAVINKVFTPPAAAAGRNGQNNNNPFQFFGGRRGGFGGPGGGGDGTPDAAPNEAKQTSSYVSATADQRANAVIITAPTEMLAQVQDLVAQVDIPSEANSMLRVFPLHFADATEIANVLAGLYPSNSTTNQRNAAGGMGGGRGAMFRQMMAPPQPAQAEKSDRKLAEATVVAVADTRTNSVIVSASPSTMSNIEVVIQQLDATPANVPNVYIYHLDNADVTDAKALLEGMFDKLDNTGTSSSSSTTTRTNRSTTGSTTGSTNPSSNRSSTGSSSASSMNR